MSEFNDEEKIFERSIITPRSPPTDERLNQRSEDEEEMTVEPGVTPAPDEVRPALQFAYECAEIIKQTIIDGKGRLNISGKDVILKKVTDMRDKILELSMENTVMKAKLESMGPDMLQIKNDIHLIKDELVGYPEKKLEGYSTAVRGEHPPATFDKSYAVLVTAKNGDEDSASMEREIKAKIKLAPLGLAVSKIKRTKQNKLVILCPTIEDAELLAKVVSERFVERFTAILKKKRWPKLILRNLTKDYELDDLQEDIRMQNPRLFPEGTVTDVFTVKKVIQLRNNESERHVLLEVPPDARRRILKQARINLGFQRLTVVDENPIYQCYHCLRAGHVSNRCLDASKSPTCSICGGEHNYKLCNRKQDKPICANCKRDSAKYGISGGYEHSTFDKEKCQYLKRMIKAAKERIEY